MGCNAWNHPPGCNCGWGGANYGTARPVEGKISYSTAREVWRSFSNPNARCPIPSCRQPVFYYQSENGGRVFFDSPGPPWPKHECTSRSTWRWPNDTEFGLTGSRASDEKGSPPWQSDGWVPVAHFEGAIGRKAPKNKDSLRGGTVWSAEDASEMKVLWPQHMSFRWNGLVMMRPDPDSPYRVDFETFQLDGDAVKVQRLRTVKNDILTTVPTLLSRLRDKR